MSAFNVEVFIKEFVDRTWYNYEAYKNSKAEYEVTQLVNSLFALLIVPNEKYKYRKTNNGSYIGCTENQLKKGLLQIPYNNIHEIIHELKRSGLYYSNYADDEQYEVSKFISHLRNALAHSGNSGLHFLPFSDGEYLTGILFYDADDFGHSFCVEMDINTIERLAKEISQLYSHIEDFDSAEKRRQAYSDEITYLRSFLPKYKK